MSEMKELDELKRKVFDSSGAHPASVSVDSSFLSKWGIYIVIPVAVLGLVLLAKPDCVMNYKDDGERVLCVKRVALLTVVASLTLCGALWVYRR